MTAQGIMVDYNYCSGCEACVLACQQEKGYSANEFGITITQLGPLAIDEAKKHYDFDFIPQFTEWCDLCEARIAKGKRPSCVQHCQAQCMTYGSVDELAKTIDDSKQMIVAIKA